MRLIGYLELPRLAPREFDAIHVLGFALRMKASTTKTHTKWWQAAIVVPVFLLAIPFLVVLLVAFAVSSVCLHVAIWIWWCARGRDILFVYSDSPIWQDYIELRLLPYLGGRAVVLNWSQRKRWHLSLALLAFRYFAGDREFNPLAVVFRPFRRTRTFRFWEPFRDFKHGRPEALRTMEHEFFSLIGVKRPEPSA